MQAGKLDRTITLERKTETVSPSGAVSETWATLATVRAELVQHSAREFFDDPGETEMSRVVLRVRYISGLTGADRVTFEGRAYDMKEIVEVGRRRALEIHVEALQ